jgi:hypothetical protein
LWDIYCGKGKGKGNVRPIAGPECPEGGRDIAVAIRDLGARRGWVVKYNAPAALPPRKIRYPLYRRMDGPQGLSGRV